MAMIEVADIGKAYPTPAGPGGTRVAVLRDVNLRVEEGAVLGLLGPNGAGKTTLIKILAGLLRPDSGGGRVLGYDLLRQPAEIRARVSLVAPTADVGIDNNLTVYQNLAFWAPIYGLRGAPARARIDELLARLDLVGKANAWPMHISAGQRQRLALARSLLARNRLVFLDEPTNKLDLEGVRSVRALIADLNAAHGVTIVLTTHVMEEAEELCGEIALLRRGVLIAHQPTVDLTRSLGLARPLTVVLRRQHAAHAALPMATDGPVSARSNTATVWSLPDSRPDASGTANWYADLAALPGVSSVRELPARDEQAQQATVPSTSVRPSGARTAAEPSGHPDILSTTLLNAPTRAYPTTPLTAIPAADAILRLVLESLDLRATTPALLAWVRARGLGLVSMHAETVTLDDVFLALAGADDEAVNPGNMLRSKALPPAADTPEVARSAGGAAAPPTPATHDEDDANDAT